MGLEMMARGGRLVYVRETGRIDAMPDYPYDATRILTPAEEDAEQQAFLALGGKTPCGISRCVPGWYCRRIEGHAGPCAAVGTTPATRERLAIAHSDVEREPTRGNTFGGRLMAMLLVGVALYVLLVALISAALRH